MAKRRKRIKATVFPGTTASAPPANDSGRAAPITAPVAPATGLGWWVVALAALAVLVRSLPLWLSGPLGPFVDYDESVYFSGSALLFEGLRPYRDFVFVHPPGVLVAWSWAGGLTDVLGPRDAFIVARVGAMLLGGASTWLLAQLLARSAGRTAGLCAGLLYAFHPEAMAVEHGPFIEPVLNVVCLGFASIWLRRDRARPKLATAAAGALLGLAVGLKLLAVIWAVGWLASASRSIPLRRSLPIVVGCAAASFALIALPFVAGGWREFFDQAIAFQFLRPQDGIPRELRPLEIWGGWHWLSTALAIGALVSRTPANQPRAARLFGAVYLLLCATFMTVGSYWPQYNAHLAPAECALAGIGTARLLAWLRGAVHLARVGFAAAVVTSLWIVVHPIHIDPDAALLAETPDVVSISERVREAGGCIAGLTPKNYLALDQLPPRSPSGRVMLDSYATMLLAAMSAGDRFPTVSEAFATDLSQGPARTLFSRCPVLLLGLRASFQLNGRSKVEISSSRRLLWASPSNRMTLWATPDGRWKL